MTNKKLYLIGTHHLDETGGERLDDLLRRISPDAIGCEFSESETQRIKEASMTPEEFSELIQETMGRPATENETRDRNKSFESYEITATKKYINRNPSAKLVHIDLVFTDEQIEIYRRGEKSMIRLLLQQDRESLLELLQNFSPENVYENPTLGAQTYKQNTQPSAEDRWREENAPEEIIDFLKLTYNPQRDDHMARNLRNLYETHNNVVGIVGVGHAIALKERLEDLNPTIMILSGKHF